MFIYVIAQITSEYTIFLNVFADDSEEAVFFLFVM